VSGGGPIFREATAADMPAISDVRQSVIENPLSIEQLAARGITNEIMAAAFLKDLKGWVAIDGEQIVGFSMADRESRSLYALFVRPEWEQRGIGARLYDLALQWLWDNGSERLWLTTSAGTKAAAFYERRGWVATDVDAYGDVRYELVATTERGAPGVR
jgi:GNAT superfamily N-acetyltransferase